MGWWVVRDYNAAAIKIINKQLRLKNNLISEPNVLYFSPQNQNFRDIMTYFKKLMKFIPELYLIIASIIYWELAGHEINYIAITLIFILIVQLIVKNRISGLFIGTVMILINLYMFLALISELREFPTFNENAYKLLIYGFLYLGANLFMAVLMIEKYGKKNRLENDNFGTKSLG